jgi:putative protein-disulfide isomerase
MGNALATLYYIHDPMCSWCWGFRPVWNEVQAALADKVNIQYLLGGLAPDSDDPMPESMQHSIRNTWQRIQREIPGTEFNYDFWVDCQPRRSTYPACRAVIAAGLQGYEYSKAMILAIQQAYYLRAKNPSDVAVLIQLSDEIGLDITRFEEDIFSETCNELLEDEILFARHLGVTGFPGLELSYKESNTLIHINYTDAEEIVSEILALV